VLTGRYILFVCHNFCVVPITRSLNREISNTQHVLRSGAIVGNTNRKLLVAPRKAKIAPSLRKLRAHKQNIPPTVMAKREKNPASMKQIMILVSLIISVHAYGQNGPLIGNEVGILEAKIETYKENILIYNQDASIWMQFDFNFENKLDNKNSYTLEDIKKLYKWNSEFIPYAFHIDYSLLMFICTGIEGDKYKVIVNKETGLEKYIKKESFWILRNWQDHLIHSVASISFDKKTNPVRVKPIENSTIIKLDGEIDPVIDPVEIKGDWLKIKYWENGNEKNGWIKWKTGNQIIVTPFYII
jgi:hypothetical protein